MAASGSGISMDCISGGGGGGGAATGGNVFPPFGEIECGSGGIRDDDVVVVAGLVLVLLVLVVVNQTKTDSEDVFRTKVGISGSSSRACRSGTLGNRFVVVRWVLLFVIVPLPHLPLLLLVVVVVTVSLFGFHWTWTACFRKVRLRKSVTE